MGWEWIIALNKFSLYMLACCVIYIVCHSAPMHGTFGVCKGSPLFRLMPYGNPTRSLRY